MLRPNRSELTGKEPMRLDIEPLPRNDDGPRVACLGAVEAFKPGVREERQIPVLTEFDGEEQVIRRKRGTVVPLRALADAPRRFHASVRQQLPQAVLDARDCFRQLRLNTTLVVEDAHPSVRQVFEAIAALERSGSRADLIGAQRRRVALNRSEDPLRRSG